MSRREELSRSAAPYCTSCFAVLVGGLFLVGENGAWCFDIRDLSPRRPRDPRPASKWMTVQPSTPVPQDAGPSQREGMRPGIVGHCATCRCGNLASATNRGAHGGKAADLHARLGGLGHQHSIKRPLIGREYSRLRGRCEEAPFAVTHNSTAPLI